jgi:hypothetical protein
MVGIALSGHEFIDAIPQHWLPEVSSQLTALPDTDTRR